MSRRLPLTESMIKLLSLIMSFVDFGVIRYSFGLKTGMLRTPAGSLSGLCRIIWSLKAVSFGINFSELKPIEALFYTLDSC